MNSSLSPSSLLVDRIRCDMRACWRSSGRALDSRTSGRQRRPERQLRSSRNKPKATSRRRWWPLWTSTRFLPKVLAPVLRLDELTSQLLDSLVAIAHQQHFDLPRPALPASLRHLDALGVETVERTGVFGDCGDAVEVGGVCCVCRM
ncbi:hypothetical protein EJ03DRAFT_164344 [Teratosphaeria nubilosa]|uniref:Uncharacterized protein n=1 Tax=Teratosphaeria nubilosa TaxID=161662 RepID=A0A6G1L286_9PEZI|nr:hypothetical protein EJ03DRAFT_164344 [Teratosphaeria nubilosa]